MFRLTYDEVIQHINVPRETYDKLATFHELLGKWQEKVNLISNSTIGEIWERHIIDSLQLLPHVPREARIIDLGSGAGFPGLMLAMAGRDVTLIERDLKKVAFLREAARTTKTKVAIISNSIEDLSPTKFDIITSRACAPLEKLLEISSMLYQPGSSYLIHKGANHRDEIAAAEKYWQFSYKIIPSITSADGVLLHVEQVQAKNKNREVV